MGQAKGRGSREDRAANPRGDSWRTEYWTEERLAEFKRQLSEEVGVWIDKVRDDLFTARKAKKKPRRIRTGG